MTKVAYSGPQLASKLRSMNDLNVSGNPRAPHADITTAPDLFGDVDFGDVDYGDAEDGDAEEGDADYGDADYGDAEEGDPMNFDTLSAYKMLSGDPSSKFGRTARKLRNPLLVAGGAALTGFALKKLADSIKRKKANKRRIAQQMSKQRAGQTLAVQRNMRRNAGKIDKNQMMPYFQVIGAKMNSSPIDSMEKFVADMFKHNLDRQASDTPFFQETAIGVYASSVWTCTAVGIASSRFYTALILQVGVNILNAAPGTIFTVTATLPTINGVLTVSTTPWIFTFENKFDCRFLFFPWQLVSNRPFPVLGQYSSSANIVVSVAGLPAASAVNLVVPGSLHPWAVAMRNALIG